MLEPCRRSAGSPSPDPRHRAAPPSPSRRSRARPASSAAARRCATRSCHSTRSCAGDLLGHRMLDLQPRVHFHEPDAVGAEALASVGDELDRAGAVVIRPPVPRAPRRRRPPRASPRPCPARALPRSPSGGGAAASSRARTGGRHCRGCRRTPAPRCGAGCRSISRAARGRRRTTTPPRACSFRARPSKSAGASTLRMPLPPPPATALISTG